MEPSAPTLKVNTTRLSPTSQVSIGLTPYIRPATRSCFTPLAAQPLASTSAREMVPGIPVKVANIEEGLPFPDGTFDYVFSKSNIEHLQHPGRMLRECYRVLRPGGVAVIMTPSWRHQWRVFYEDYTHVSPFTVNGLSDALTIAGFHDVEVKLFWQLPFLWKRPWL